MGAQRGFVAEAEGNVDLSAGIADLLVAGDQRTAGHANGLAHGVTQFRVQNRAAVLQLAAETDDTGLAVVFDGSAKLLHADLAEHVAELRADLVQRGEVFNIASGHGVLDNGRHRDAADRLFRGGEALKGDVFLRGDDFSDFDCHDYYFLS